MDEIEVFFRDFGKARRWRMRVDEDKTYIAKTRSRKWPEDHLFIWSKDYIGIAIRRDTIKKYRFMSRKLQDIGCEIITEGDLEGNFKVKINGPIDDIASLLKVVKTANVGRF